MPAAVVAEHTGRIEPNVVIDRAPIDSLPIENTAVDTAPVDTAPVDTAPLATFPRRIRGHGADGLPWELLTSRTGVEVVSRAGRFAEAQVSDEAERVVLDFRSEAPGVPGDVAARLVEQAFAHPAVRTHRPVLVALPRGESAVLAQVLARTDGGCRVAGVTCLVEGRVRATR
ncbi:hypothetical protein [Geodermatophilus sp. SYSU D00815]